MEAILFFFLLVAALLALNIVDMVSKHRGKPAPGLNAHAASTEEAFTDSTGRPLHGPALARARAARRAAARAAAMETAELSTPAESASK